MPRVPKLPPMSSIKGLTGHALAAAGGVEAVVSVVAIEENLLPAQSIENAKIPHDAILLVGFDALPEEVKEIIAGREDGSVAQYPAKMGELGVDTVVRAVRGEAVPAKVDTGTAMVTKENAKDFK